MARGKPRRTVKKKRSQPWAGATHPTPLKAIEEKHREFADRLAARPDRYSQLLARSLHDERSGMYLATRSGLSLEDHAELVAMTPVAHEDLRAELAAAIANLRDLLATGEALYILALVQHMNLIVAWGDYFEPTHQGSEAKIELVAGLLAAQPQIADAPPSDEDMQRIFDEIDHIVDVGFLFNLSMPRTDDIVADTQRFTAATRWMTVRGTSYEHHGIDLALRLYEPHDAWMLSNVGFTIEDVITVAKAVDSLVIGHTNDLIREARRFADEMLKIGLTHLKRGRLEPPVAALLSSREGRESVRQKAAIDVFQPGIREAFTFSAEQIQAAAPAIDAARVDALLSELSIEVGSLDPARYTGLFDASPLREKPFLRSDETYDLPVPGMLSRDAVVLLERRLIEGVPGFSRSRAKTLDRLAVDYLADLLPGARTFTNLGYLDTELDGLVLFDDVAVVVEGKASPLSVQGQRGDLRRLESDLRDAIDAAAQQGARARDYLLEGGPSVFRDERGRVVLEIPLGIVREVFVVTPTAHELAGHSLEIDRPRALGLFPDGRYPWSVFINDLRVISETCENAAVFLHYLGWRSRLPLGAQILVGDELDLWSSYLVAERFPFVSGPNNMMVGNSSTDLDAYYEGVLGRGPRTKPPQKFLPELLRNFVERMTNERPAGWRKAAGVCLDLSIPELAFVDSKAAEVAVTAARERRFTWIDADRVALVGVPVGVDPVKTLQELDVGPRDPTFLVAVEGRTTRKVRVVWATYRKAVDFELSEFEKWILGGVANPPQ